MAGEQPQISPDFLLGLAVGLFLGAIVGFIIAKRNKQADNQVTATMILSIIVAGLYIVGSLALAYDPNPFIVGLFLAVGYGSKGGELLEKFLEKR